MTNGRPAAANWRWVRVLVLAGTPISSASSGGIEVEPGGESGQRAYLPVVNGKCGVQN